MPTSCHKYVIQAPRRWSRVQTCSYTARTAGMNTRVADGHLHYFLMHLCCSEGRVDMKILYCSGYTGFLTSSRGSFTTVWCSNWNVPLVSYRWQTYQHVMERSKNIMQKKNKLQHTCFFFYHQEILLMHIILPHVFWLWTCHKYWRRRAGDMH